MEVNDDLCVNNKLLQDGNSFPDIFDEFLVLFIQIIVLCDQRSIIYPYRIKDFLYIMTLNSDRCTLNSYGNKTSLPS